MCLCFIYMHCVWTTCVQYLWRPEGIGSLCTTSTLSCWAIFPALVFLFKIPLCFSSCLCLSHVCVCVCYLHGCVHRCMPMCSRRSEKNIGRPPLSLFRLFPWDRLSCVSGWPTAHSLAKDANSDSVTPAFCLLLWSSFQKGRLLFSHFYSIIHFWK